MLHILSYNNIIYNLFRYFTTLFINIKYIDSYFSVDKKQLFLVNKTPQIRAVVAVCWINCINKPFLTNCHLKMKCSECCSVFWLSFLPIRSEQLAHKKKADLSEQPIRTGQIGASLPTVAFQPATWPAMQRYHLQ